MSGGTRVTIAGSGFGSTVSDVKVSFGDSLCDVVSVNVSTIVCVTRANVAGNHTMNVSSTLFSVYSEVCCLISPNIGIIPCWFTHIIARTSFYFSAH